MLEKVEILKISKIKLKEDSVKKFDITVLNSTFLITLEIRLDNFVKI